MFRVISFVMLSYVLNSSLSFNLLDSSYALSNPTNLVVFMDALDTKLSTLDICFFSSSESVQSA